MFTGLIENVGRLRQLWREHGGARIAVAHSPFEDLLRVGESVAVQGVCLSVVDVLPDAFVADVLEETLSRSALGALPVGSALNLERAMRLDSRVGGHFVTGHIDETGRVDRMTARDRDQVLRVSCSPGLATLCVEKGSIAMNGASLTVTAVGENWMEVHLIPITWRDTSLGELQRNDAVHLEADLIGKYVARLLRGRDASAGDGGLAERMRTAGF